jgi:predicted Zn-dependent protease
MPALPSGVTNAAIDKLGDGVCAFLLTLKKDKKISTDSAEEKTVQRVKDRLVEAAKRSPQYGDAAKSINWRVQVLDEKTENAYTCPGGQIVVYTGIFRPARNEAELAAVLGHEMTHALVRDTNPPLGATTISSAAAIAAGIATAKSVKDLKPEQTALVAAVGLGAVVGVSQAFSRQQELNADQQGVLIMALAGYDPEEYSLFLSRLMSPNCAEKGKLPEFLLSHPEPDTRYKEIEKSAELMKQAKDLYSKADKVGSGATLPGEHC